jgi:hypothetical protein
MSKEKERSKEEIENAKRKMDGSFLSLCYGGKGISLPPGHLETILRKITSQT